MSSTITTFMQHRMEEHDKEWQGDHISPDKGERTTRVMYHNVNGLTLRGSDGFDIFLHEQSLMQVDIQAISEHCLDTTKFSVTQAANKIAHSHQAGKVTLQLDSSTEPAVHHYKPGGTGLIAIGPVTGRLEPQGRGGDRMGRWSYFHFRRKHLPPLTVISVYQVCPTPTNHIGNTAFHQQQRILNSKGQTGVHPRRAFQQDLSRFLSELRRQDHDILLGGDFNEALTDTRSGVFQLATTHNLLDPFLYKHPNYNQFGTHINGQRRIDIVLMTPRLLPSLQKIGYAPFHHTTPSDHRQIVLDFATDLLFGTTNIRIQDLQNRSLRSNDKKAVSQYITVMYEEILRRGGFSYQRELETNNPHPNVAELVDAIIGQSGDRAEEKCRRRRPTFFSQPLVQQRLKVSILRGHLNGLKSQRDRTAQLEQRMTRLAIEVNLPPTQKLTRQALHEARTELQLLLQKHESARQEELANKISEANHAQDKKRAKIIRSIKKVETGRQTYHILRSMRRKQGQFSLDRLEVPASWPQPTETMPDMSQLEDPKRCDEWRTVTDPQELEYYLVLRNRLHFGQAEKNSIYCQSITRRH